MTVINLDSYRRQPSRVPVEDAAGVAGYRAAVLLNGLLAAWSDLLRPFTEQGVDVAELVDLWATGLREAADGFESANVPRGA